MNHNQLIDDTLVKSAMERICAKTTEIFLERLARISNGGGYCFENTLVSFSEHITEEDYDSEDYAFLEGKRFQGAYIYCEWAGDPVIMSYQEFYEVLCHYVAIRIANENDEIQSAARKHLNIFKERYHLTS